MEFRIGINLGDIIEEESRIYGDGVNVAARLEGIADPGGIYISGSAYEQIASKLALGYEDLGEHVLKNISRPVRIYKIPMGFEAETGTGLQKGGRPPEKPSIAVLPFDNMSSDPEQEHFSDGMTDEVITRLSMNSLLMVIARKSTFQYKGKPVRVQQVGQELGVGYALEGSVRKAGNSVRITAQLVDTATGVQLWANTYDRELVDIIVLQEEIALQITSAVNAFCAEAEISRVRGIPYENLTARDALWRAQELFFQRTQSANIEARELCERAIDLDPDFNGTYEILGFTHLADYLNGWNPAPQEALDSMYGSAQKALSLNTYSADAHDLLSHIYAFRDQRDRAIAEIDRAIAIAPNADNLYADKAHILIILGRPGEAIGLVRRAMHLNPHYPSFYAFILGTAYLDTGRYEEAIKTLEGALALNPGWIKTYCNLASTYRLMGRYGEAIETIEEAISRNPDSAMAYRELVMDCRMAWETTENTDPLLLNRALEMAEKMVAIDESDLGGHAEMSLMNLHMKQDREALSRAEELVALAPENADSHATLAFVLNAIGRSDEAIEMLEKAIRPNHSTPPWYLTTLGDAYRLSGRQTEAVETQKRVFEHTPSHADAFRAHLSLAILYVELGREEEARSEALQVLAAAPNFSLELWGRRVAYKDPTFAERDMAALREAGL